MNSEQIIWRGSSIHELNRAINKINEVDDKIYQLDEATYIDGNVDTVDTQITIGVPDTNDGGSLNTFNFPWPLSIRDDLTTRSVASDGTLYVYVTIEFDSVDGASTYEIRTVFS